MWLPWMEFAAVLTLATLLTIPMGQWLARCFTSEHHTWLERCTYGALGVNPQERMTWQRYGASLLLSNAMMMLLGYLILRVQGLPSSRILAVRASTSCGRSLRRDTSSTRSTMRATPSASMTLERW